MALLGVAPVREDGAKDWTMVEERRGAVRELIVAAAMVGWGKSDCFCMWPVEG